MDWNGWKLRVKRLLGVMIRAIRVSGIVHLKVPVLIGGGGGARAGYRGLGIMDLLRSIQQRLSRHLKSSLDPESYIDDAWSGYVGLHALALNAESALCICGDEVEPHQNAEASDGSCAMFSTFHAGSRQESQSS